MFGNLVRKELRSIILSPKFTATFAVCSILLLLSVYIGVREYRQATAQYETAVNLAQQRMLESTSWHAVRDKTFRRPEPMNIFVSGLGYDIGRWTEISAEHTVKLKNSAYSDDPIFAVFRFIDFAFIVQVVFSLFAILFTYDAINGERERGTLRLVFSNAVPRARYLIAKCFGSWLGLVIPVSIPIILALLLVNLYSIPLTATDWGKLLLLIGISLTYVTLFVVMGVFISSLTKRSNVSFLLSLVLWVAFVLVIPRGGVMAAGQITSVPQRAEIEGQRDGYAQNRWNQYYNEMEERLMAQRDAKGASDGCETDFDDEASWTRFKAEDSARKEVQKEIDEYEVRLLEDWNHRKAVQQRLGFALTRISPASSYQLAAMTLAGTDINMKSRYEDALGVYRQEFNQYVDQKQSESDQIGGIVISISSEDGLKIGSSRDNDGLDLAERPMFTPPTQSFTQVLEPIVVDFGLMLFGTILSFAGAFVSFSRYDLR